MYNCNNFLDLLYSVIQNNGIEMTDYDTIMDIIEVIYSSEEFKSLQEKLRIFDFNLEKIRNNKHTLNIEDNGIISFHVDEDEQNRILKRWYKDGIHIQNAINKYSMSKFISIKTQGKVDFQYDDPDGDYSLPFKDNPMEECETKLYTDGILTEDEIKNDLYYTKVRNIMIAKSTFTMLVDYIKNQPQKIVLRAITESDLPTICYDAQLILQNLTYGYNPIDNNKPGIYKLKRH